MTATIYKLTFPDGREYIGATTTSVERRISRHLSSDHNTDLRAAFDKFKDDVRWRVLARVPVSKMEAAETRAIIKHKTICPGGLNRKVGAIECDQTRRKKSASARRRANTPEGKKQMRKLRAKQLAAK